MTRPLVFEDFADRVGQDFVIDERDLAGIPMTLTEAELLHASRGKPGLRPPFSLVFVGKHQHVLEQRLYKFDLAGIGKVDIFLVPIGKDETGVSYQALFN
jgi:hypothetical protein